MSAVQDLTVLQPQPAAHVTLIYSDKDGALYEQPLDDITQSGTLIDPENGDDLDLLGWRPSALIYNSQDLSLLPPGTIVTGNFPLETTVAEKTLDDLWIMAGVCGHVTNEELDAISDGDLVVLRLGS